MAIWTLIAGPGATLADAVQVTPSFVVLLLLTGIVLSLLYAYQPPLPQTMAFAFVPWIVTASFLDVLATDGQYSSYLEPLFTVPGAYLVAVVIPGFVWIAMLNGSVSKRALPAYHHYIGTMGLGALAILGAALIVHVGTADLSRMLVLVVVPLTALLAAGLISLTIGLWSPDFVEYTAFAGGFALFGALVNGIATTTSVAAKGATAHTAFSTIVRDVVAVSVPNGVAGFGVTQLWVWVFLLANVAIGIHVATQLAPYADKSPRAVNAMLGIVGVVGFTLGFNQLLVVVVG